MSVSSDTDVEDNIINVFQISGSRDQNDFLILPEYDDDDDGVNEVQSIMNMIQDTSARNYTTNLKLVHTQFLSCYADML